MDDHTKEYPAIEDTKPAGRRPKIIKNWQTFPIDDLPPLTVLSPRKIVKTWGGKDKPQTLPTKKEVEGSAAPRESTKNKQVGFSSAVPSSTNSGGKKPVPVSKPFGKVQSGQPALKDSVNGLLDDPTYHPSRDEPRYFLRANPKRQVPPAATEGDGSSARKRPKLTECEPGQPRRTENKIDFYSKMAAIIREKSSSAMKEPTSCTTCQTELQDLRKAISTMNDTLDAVVKKLDAMAQDARLYRKGTQCLVAAAYGEETPADSDNDA
ncbi:uncharacterized protein TrAFT101_004305 [Trichoderma asperellum]|uniref:uncharacterized protein n=1 Tax=Trichoderma asperellum TaxID=101201 RepID=UPI003320D686|nr:hypothetical protein TrAFT101_004305 [Trichoderma asperellum]